jgi:superfamily II DNA or RNA helicase
VNASIVASEGAPEVGDLVRVRGQQWLVTARRDSGLPVDELARHRSPGRSLVELTNVSEDLGESLTLAWDVEPGRQVLAQSQLPQVTNNAWDDPQAFGALLDAVRWGTVASADEATLQAPFRAGIAIEEYQLEPVAKALSMPRVNLLIADDVGLGKTIEAGLVLQEMLLRHRARRIIVVCPAPLTQKWHEEMDSRFGLDFLVLDAQALRDVRRSHGQRANPFTVFPRTIISLPWLRTPRVQRLLDEVLTGERRNGYFDVLVVDEAHHVAPSAPATGKRYAVDSRQTEAVRRLAAHAGNRLFLSATPHNGYSESWQSLLEMLDPQRFARGVEPEPAMLQQVLVRRLKDNLLDEHGAKRFAGRFPRSITVTYSDDEKSAHELLQGYLKARRRGRPGQAGDLVSLLLKKRLFSSPEAFHRTLETHAASVHGAAAASGEDLPEWLLAEVDDLDVDDTATSEADALAVAEEHLADMDEDAAQLLDRLRRWAADRAPHPDAKALELKAELEALAPDDRVIVFTEYRDTQRWLEDLLTAWGLAGPRLGVLYGGMDIARREHLKAAFQAPPEAHPVRILLATDAASEGIDLQEFCHRVVHYDIPFNPNRLEQRIGRVDRYGQRHDVDVAHFVGAGWEDAEAGSFSGDLEFLSRVAQKVATERRDLGSVNPVLAHAVESRMLGHPVLVDPMSVSPNPSVSVLRAERDLRSAAEDLQEQARRLKDQLDASIAALHVAPPNVRRVVDQVLATAGQPALQDAGDGTIAHPALRFGWERYLARSIDPLTRQPLRLTFDATRASRDVVHAHLGHPLVANAVRLLRSEVWGSNGNLHRVTAVEFDAPDAAAARGPVVVLFARLVVVGADGGRLHEEIVLAARELPQESGRSRRVDLEARGYADLREAVERALDPDRCRAAAPGVRERLVDEWEALEPRLVDDLDRRATQQREALDRDLSRRRQAEERRVEELFDRLRVTLQQALSAPTAQQLSFEDLDVPELRQLERDRRAWQDRLDSLDADREAELDRVARRYSGARTLQFPFGVAVCVPARQDGEGRD